MALVIHYKIQFNLRLNRKLNWIFFQEFSTNREFAFFRFKNCQIWLFFQRKKSQNMYKII